MPIGGIIDIVGRLILKLVILVSIGFVAIAIADFFYQRWQYKKELRMTKYEVKREYKQEEGDPQHKAARKRLHQEIAMHDMVQAVKDADVVIVNPTHIAAAIKYNPDEMTAPQLVAKGQRLIAEQIVEIAKQYKVPIMRNLPLAQSLMELEIGEEIPEELYEAVAEVLNFVYRLAEQQEEG
jgi:flagellar biosynthetic protein FlhB